MATEEAHSLATELVAACRRTLPPLAGAILHGSLATGTFVPGRSDVDVLAIVDSRPSDDQLDALVAAVGALAGRATATADLRVVTRAAAAMPTPAPPMEAYLRLEKHGLDLETRSPGERDLVIEFSVCRAHGVSLVGPAPAELIGDVPDEWVQNVGTAVLADWLQQDYNPSFGAFMVLTACRIWRFAEQRVHCSKTEAARWVLERDPSQLVVRAALDGNRVDEADVRALLSAVQTATLDEPRRSPGLAGA